MAKTMTREEEIKTLQSLKGNTYFGQIFDNDTIDQMCENIKNDFGIECGVELLEKANRVEKAESDKRRLQHENNDLQDAKDKLMYIVFHLMYSNDISLDYVETYLHNTIGMTDTCIYKLKYETPLSEKERDNVVETLKFNANKQ